ncbi:3-oxoacyl-ACP synthase III family protein [Williamwhitmania taraxaci]|uniref:3-oxoacyl-[acyl-carrier-protein] synthase III n=1 Tax=Williamwhitmania taraxaci TaxID=1640674 RepID=A0A1G6QTI4_9BACT|nr:3-oxoacyl-[acyl-carrier-protein] synthase III C-terminal domain-containing protein [Williamwhitmania taraxaci]SDC95037.1 3-oxoacyl-[acyl-carrier-protein] synthase III [Williamwhitmania taraxaci]
MKSNSGVISMGGYYPGKAFPVKSLAGFVNYLKANTHLPVEYIQEIETTGQHPGWSESNEDGWVNQPWYDAWIQTLPEKKRQNPFQGGKFRCRVPMDPESIRSSRFPHPMLASDAETIAGAMAIFSSGLSKEDIDLVIVSSLVPDRHVPLNASLVQHKLQLPNAGAYNMDTCCSSFITMMETAMALVNTGVKKNILIVASSLDSIINDKSTYYSVCTGDAAVAGIVSKVEEGCGYITSASISNGARHEAIVFQSRQPLLFKGTSQGPTHEQECVTFLNPELTRQIGATAQEDMLHVVSKALDKRGLSSKHIDFAAFHQPVKWAPHAWREAIGLAPEKIVETYELYGNIACAAAATNMLVALERKLIKANDNLLIASSGVGENHIALLQKVSVKLVENMNRYTGGTSTEKLQPAKNLVVH